MNSNFKIEILEESYNLEFRMILGLMDIYKKVGMDVPKLAMFTMNYEVPT
jgi:hypothetical protein